MDTTVILPFEASRRRDRTISSNDSDLAAENERLRKALSETAEMLRRSRNVLSIWKLSCNRFDEPLVCDTIAFADAVLTRHGAVGLVTPRTVAPAMHIEQGGTSA